MVYNFLLEIAMEILNQIPEWFGIAVLGAVTSVIGFFANNLWKWWNNQHESKRQRRARLERLDRLLDESLNLFLSQRSQAQRLFESIQRTQPSIIAPDLSLDQVFSRAFSNLSRDEAQLHKIIRGVTETALRRVNTEMADWLRNDDWFKQAKHSSNQLNQLATELQQLELHLNEWHAKFLSVFQNDQFLALNYLADEQKQGTGFPVGIESLVKQVLKEIL